MNATSFASFLAIYSHVLAVLPVVSQFEKNKQERSLGGYFTLLSSKEGDGRAMFTFLTGDCPSVCADTHQSCSVSNARWLYKYKDNISSYTVSDSTVSAGAIRARDNIFSFSGISPAVDEAVVTVVAKSFLLISSEQAHAIFDLSNNHVGRLAFKKIFSDHA